MAPHGETEELLAGHLDRAAVGEQGARLGARDDFFALGGHSLLAAQMISRLCASCSRSSCRLRDVFEKPTISRLARRIERLREEGSAAALPPLVPVPRDRELPLSFAQQRLWFLDQLEPGQSVYNIPVALRLAGRFDLAVMERAIGEVVRRHEVLRTTFAVADGRPVQVIAPPGGFGIELPPLRAAVRERGRACAARPRSRVRVRSTSRPDRCPRPPLAPRRGRPRRPVAAHQTSRTAGRPRADARDSGALRGVRGQPVVALPELPIQYADYAVWQREGWPARSRRRRVVGGELAATQARLRDRPAAHGGADTRRVTRPFQLDAAITDRARTLGAAAARRCAWTLLAASRAARARPARATRWSHPIAAAPAARGALIGFFVNTLVLRARSTAIDILRLLARVRETALGASAPRTCRSSVWSTCSSPSATRAAIRSSR